MRLEVLILLMIVKLKLTSHQRLMTKQVEPCNLAQNCWYWLLFDFKNPN